MLTKSNSICREQHLSMGLHRFFSCSKSINLKNNSNAFSICVEASEWGWMRMRWNARTKNFLCFSTQLTIESSKICIRRRVGKDVAGQTQFAFFWIFFRVVLVLSWKHPVTLTFICAVKESLRQKWKLKIRGKEIAWENYGKNNNMKRERKRKTQNVFNSLCHFALVKLITLNERTRNVKWHWMLKTESNLTVQCRF